MKKTILLLAIIVCAGTMMLSAQDVNKSKKPRMSSTYIKDPCNGGRINFGVTFGQAFDWMYDHTEGYKKNGIVIGLDKSAACECCRQLLTTRMGYCPKTPSSPPDVRRKSPWKNRNFFYG